MPRQKDAGSDHPLIAMLLEITDQAFDRKSWHGTTLRGALRGLTPEEALWRPGPARHNIWELTLHAAYWKYAVRRRLAGDAIGSFERKPSNWPEIPDPSDAGAWKRDVAFLESEHRKLRETIQRLRPSDLSTRSPRGVWTYAEEIHGIAAHDLYHTGQIQLIKRLMP
ncbi:MAG TPA: DinB family protein [Gemmatimonadales bacterium]|nr:DinB family protein [Gemmatimonadales bacterium]